MATPCEETTTTLRVDNFVASVDYAKENLGVSCPLKEKQLTALRAAYDGKDSIVVLPTGYGKSLVFQLLPWLLQKRDHRPLPVISFVISPLNSIIQDQVTALVSRGVQTCFLDITGSSATTYELLSAGSQDPFVTGSDDEEREEESPVFTQKSVSLAELRRGKYCLIYAHPEALVSNSIMSKILRSRLYQERTGCIAIDEVHMVTEWGKDFRTAFTKLADVNSIFPDAVHLAVTATLTPAALKTLTETLQLKEPEIIQMNPDRPNIYIDVRPRLPNIRKLDKYDELIRPLCSELTEKRLTFPVTIAYVDNLDAMGYYYQFLEHSLGEDAYLEGKPRIPENRIFGMYHKDYTSKMKSLIITELKKTNPRLRLVLATVALGMGLDAPSVSQVIHFRPPTTIEKYMQEIGRAGRSGQQATSIMYYNNSDLATNRPGLSPSIAKFCRNQTTCLRKDLLAHFGFSTILYSGSPHFCCSNCRKKEESPTS